MTTKAEKKYNSFQELKEQVSKQLEELLKLDVEELKYKNEDIKYMINYYNDLTDKIEDRRIRIHNFSLQILTVSVAAVALLITTEKIIITGYTSILYYIALIILSTLIIASLYTSFIFIFQSSFVYPFNESDTLEGIGQNKWKWFYYGNQKIFDIKTKLFGRTKNNFELEEACIPYLENLKDFIASYKDENLHKEISDNIQQLYIRHVHNYYKNRFYLQLTRIWKMAFAVITALLLVAILLLLLYKCFGQLSVTS